jgi:hypothetical protein
LLVARQPALADGRDFQHVARSDRRPRYGVNRRLAISGKETLNEDVIETLILGRTIFRFPFKNGICPIL